MTLLYQLWAFLKRDYLLASSSRLTFAWQIVSVAFVAPTLYYLGRLMQPGASPHLAAFGGSYFAFVILGVALFGFFASVMTAAANAVRQEQLIGTLEPVLASPISLFVLALGGTLWNTLVAAGQALLYLVLAVMVFGVQFGSPGMLTAGLFAVLTASTFSALGVMAAAFVLVFKHADPITTVFTAFSSLLAGVFYPTTVLPPALQTLARLIPLTYGLRAIRLALLEGHTVWALRGELLVLALFAAMLIPCAGLIFRWAVQQSKSAGTLGTY